MVKYIGKRILQIIPTLLVLSFILFFSIWFMQYKSISFGGEDSTFKQYLDYMGNVLRGDFGIHYRYGRPINGELMRRYPLTMLLAIGGTLTSAIVGIFLGVISAVNQNKLIDNIIMFFSLAVTSIPLFFLALIFMVIFSVFLGVLPSRAMGSWQSFIMPVITLGLPAAGFVARTTRSAMLEVINQDYIRASQARGIADKTIIYYHALKNTFIPIITVIGVRFGELLAGTVLVENAFSIPGLGRFIIEAIDYRQGNAILGCVLVLAATFMVINLLIDILYALIDPRVKYGKRESSTSGK
ncbi:ABC transporter permease [Anaeropeptidivorans aminofermentans]|uniref:ABC transporter permease n=1 Tax=Anaeropeptidivorans aminofermentans TaxID=2934315 RepID=UPI0020249B31|nr:ABC transporter permease [Anaeropeptidivorans aminofermentans]